MQVCTSKKNRERKPKREKWNRAVASLLVADELEPAEVGREVGTEVASALSVTRKNPLVTYVLVVRLPMHS